MHINVDESGRGDIVMELDDSVNWVEGETPELGRNQLLEPTSIFHCYRPVDLSFQLSWYRALVLEDLDAIDHSLHRLVEYLLGLEKPVLPRRLILCIGYVSETRLAISVFMIHTSYVPSIPIREQSFENGVSKALLAHTWHLVFEDQTQWLS